MNLADLQAEHRVWVEHNFPGQTSAQMMMGLIEELGELAHAQLKLEQNIRGSADLHREAMEDAVGDLVIYLSSYCTTQDLNLAKCVQNAWDEVKQRDWVRFPETGRPSPLRDMLAAERAELTVADMTGVDDMPEEPQLKDTGGHSQFCVCPSCQPR